MGECRFQVSLDSFSNLHAVVAPSTETRSRSRSTGSVPRAPDDPAEGDSLVVQPRARHGGGRQRPTSLMEMTQDEPQADHLVVHTSTVQRRSSRKRPKRPTSSVPTEIHDGEGDTDASVQSQEANVDAKVAEVAELDAAATPDTHETQHEGRQDEARQDEAVIQGEAAKQDETEKELLVQEAQSDQDVQFAWEATEKHVESDAQSLDDAPDSFVMAEQEEHEKEEAVSGTAAVDDSDVISLDEQPDAASVLTICAHSTSMLYVSNVCFAATMSSSTLSDSGAAHLDASPTREHQVQVQVQVEEATPQGADTESAYSNMMESYIRSVRPASVHSTGESTGDAASLAGMSDALDSLSFKETSTVGSVPTDDDEPPGDFPPDLPPRPDDDDDSPSQDDFDMLDDAADEHGLMPDASSFDVRLMLLMYMTCAHQYGVGIEFVDDHCVRKGARQPGLQVRAVRPPYRLWCALSFSAHTV